VLAAILFAALLWVLSGPTPAHADPGTIYVAPGAACGTGYTPCYGEIQAAVDAAVPGDEIRVAAGTYTGVGARGGVTQVVYISKTVTIQGGYDTTDWTTSDAVVNPTTLDAQRQGRVLTIIGDIDVSIQDLRITGGDAASPGGGGVYVDDATVTIARSDVFSNVASTGGGVFISYPEGALLIDNDISDNLASGVGYGSGGGGVFTEGDVTLLDNTIANNRARANGGGIMSWYGLVTLKGNTISDNVAGYGGVRLSGASPQALLMPQTGGGGFYLDGGSALLTDNTISGNSAQERGGGVFGFFYTDVTLNDNTVTGNTTDGWGGGVYVLGIDWSGDVRMRGNVIADNSAQSQGGGLSLAIREGSAKLTNNVFVGNRAGASGSGVYVEPPASLLHTTLADNSGGDGIGVYISTGYGAHGAVDLVNTVVVSHQTGIKVTAGCTVTADGILFYDTPSQVSWDPTATVTVQNGVVGDPAFAPDGYHLTPGSAAVDAGVDVGVMEDLDGQYRPFGDGPDLGADEWSSTETVVDPGQGGGGVLMTMVGGFTSTVEVPSNAVTTTTTLEFTALATTTQGSPAGAEFAGLAFDLDAYQDGALVPGFAFSVPVTITLDYGEGDVAGLDENSLVLETWDGSAWQDAACGPYERNPGENWLSVPVCHLSRFALFGERGVTFSVGEPGLSFRYVETFGVTEEAYIADTQHLNRPNGLFIDDSDSLYVVEEWGSRMLKYRTLDGANLLSIGVAGLQNRGEYSFDHPQDVAVDSSGYIWVVDRHRAAQYDAGGGFLQELPPDDPWNSGSDNTHFDTPRGIAFDSAGRMYIADSENHRIQIYSFSGGDPVYSTTIGVTGVSGTDNGHFHRPSQIVFDSSGRLYVTDVRNSRVQRCTYAGGWACTTFHGTGTQGGNPDELSWAYGLAIDSADNIYIADNGNGRVKRCDSGGSCATFVMGFGAVADVAVDSSGSVYVSDWEDFTVRKYTSSGVSQGIFAGASGVPYLTDGGHFNAPYGVAVNGSGNIYLSTYRGYRVLKLNASGIAQWTAGIAGVDGDDNDHFGNWWNGPDSLAVDSNGNVYVADTGNNRIQIYDSGGHYVATWGTYGSGDDQFNDLDGVAVDSNGNIYVADSGNHRVQVYDGDRQYVATLGVTGVSGTDDSHFNRPYGVAVDNSGNVYVADGENNRVQKCVVVGSGGTCVPFVGTVGEWDDGFDHFGVPRDVAVDDQGRVYVADIYNQRVQVFDSDGSYLTTIGGQWGSSSGQMRQAAAVDVDSAGNVYIADHRNHRIQKFSPGVPGWGQVNINGFGDRVNYAVSGLMSFGSQLYAGTYNPETGAQLWRQGPGTAWMSPWTAVFTDGLGDSSNVGIDHLIEFKDDLYVGTWNESDGGSNGGQIWRSDTGGAGDWEMVISGGFTDTNNTEVFRFAVHNDQLYAAAWNPTNGGELWRTSSGDIGSWTPVVVGGFGNADNRAIVSLVEFGGYLYAGTDNSDTGAEVWRSVTGDDGSWSKINTGGFGDPYNWSITLEPFKSYMYAGVYNYWNSDNPGAELWRCQQCNGFDWQQVPIAKGFGDTENRAIRSLFAFNDGLFAFTYNNTTGMEVWRTTDGADWKQEGLGGLGDSNNSRPFWDNSIAAFNNRLYVGTLNFANGGEIWKRTVIADFAASPTQGPPPLTVVFNNTSAGEYTQAWWDYGDGTGYTGTLLLPTHVYSATGSYTVSLTVSDGVDTSTLVRPNYVWVGHGVYLPMVVRGYQ
jgi:PKD repeat protein/uncharacterized protein YjiK